MKRFVVYTCLLVATVSCASISKDIEGVNSDIKTSENLLSLLNFQLKDLSARHEDPSLIQNLRVDVSRLGSELNNMRKLTADLALFLKPSNIQRARRSAEERQNMVVETTQTVVNSAAVGIQSTLNTLNNLMININRGVNNIFNRLTNQITNVAVSANNAAQSGVASLNNGAQTAITNANNAATAVVNTVYTGVQGAAQGVGSAIQTGYNAVSTGVSSTVNAAANTVNRLTG